jgi:hypothetical protein
MAYYKFFKGIRDINTWWKNIEIDNWWRIIRIRKIKIDRRINAFYK